MDIYPHEWYLAFMRAEELDNLTEDELQRKADECFIQAENTNVHLSGGGFERLRLHLEAQYYLTAVSKKRDDRVAHRDFRMEVWVIVLIGIEIMLSVIFGIVGIREGIQQAQVLTQMDASAAVTASAMIAASNSLHSLSDAQAKSLDRLSQMSDTLSDSLKTSGTMAGAARKQLNILQQEQADREAQLAKKSKLQLIIFPARDQTDTSVTFDSAIANWGSAPATRIEIRIEVFANDVSFSSSENVYRVNSPTQTDGQTYLIDMDLIRRNVSVPMTLTFIFPKGHAPFQVHFNVDADEIETATPLGELTITPRAPAN